MELSEKLKAILSLTSVKNNELAKAVNVDSAQISRLRTGVRKSPRDPNFLRNIADYLATRFNGEYMYSALFDLTHDTRLQINCDETTLSKIIYEWLTDNNSPSFLQVDKFLNRFNDFTTKKGNVVTQAKSTEPVEVFDGNLCRIYMKNSGKRQATKDFCNYIMSMDKPCIVKIFSDETDDWLLEHRGFLNELTKQIDFIARKGCRTTRILPPSRNIESSFRDIERWMPAYMEGTIRLYTYPWARDELHRMTMLLVPGKIVMYSMSLYGQRELGMTVLNTDPRSVIEREKYFDAILERCKPSLSVTTLSDKSKILNKIQEISRIMDNGVYKSSRLSAHTISTSTIALMKKRGTPYVSRVLECYAQNEQFKINVLKSYSITDVMSLPNIKNVIAGKEPIPGTAAGKDTLYYTPCEYRQHLEHIIWYLEAFPNYRAVFLDEHELKNVVIYSKGNDHVLLIKEADPFALFEITESSFSATLVSYLKSIAKEKLRDNSRKDTLTRLRNEISMLDFLMSSNLQNNK